MRELRTDEFNVPVEFSSAHGLRGRKRYDQVESIEIELRENCAEVVNECSL